MSSIEPIPKPPLTAMRYFMQLYHMRKTKNKIPKRKASIEFNEAIKTYVSLSKTEKKELQKKYEEHKQKYLEYIAHRLQQVKPYLNKKKQTITSSGIEENVESNITESISNEENIPQKELQVVTQPEVPSEPQTETQSASQNEIQPVTQQEFEDEENVGYRNSHIYFDDDGDDLDIGNNHVPLDDSVSCNEEQQTIHKYNELPEPNPPFVRNGSELFRMVKDNQETDWLQLPHRIKQRYHNAVSKIKKKYIKDYQLYLESLPNAKLLKHYRKVMGS